MSRWLVLGLIEMLLALSGKRIVGKVGRAAAGGVAPALATIVIKIKAGMTNSDTSLALPIRFDPWRDSMWFSFV
jgi:hypothetical protein